MRFDYWNNIDFYRAVYKDKKVQFFEERAEKGLKKFTVGISIIDEVLGMAGREFKTVRNEYNKYAKRNVKIERVCEFNISMIDRITKRWNMSKRHFMTWAGQGKRFIQNGYKKYPCFIYFLGNQPAGYNAFFTIDDTIVWAVSKTVDGENGLSSFMLIEGLKKVRQKETYLNLTSYGLQKKYKQKFNPRFEKNFYKKEIK